MSQISNNDAPYHCQEFACNIVHAAVHTIKLDTVIYSAYYDYLLMAYKYALEHNLPYGTKSLCTLVMLSLVQGQSLHRKS